VLCDEVYRHLTQKDEWCESIVDLYEKGISVSNMSKVFSFFITGWRLGYVIGPSPVIEVAKKVHDFLTAGAATPGSSFFRESVSRYIRFHFARSEEVLNEALLCLERMLMCGKVSQ